MVEPEAVALRDYFATHEMSTPPDWFDVPKDEMPKEPSRDDFTWGPFDHQGFRLEQRNRYELAWIEYEEKLKTAKGIHEAKRCAAWRYYMADMMLKARS